ncbi:MAG: methyltransferase [bacterium]
MKSDFHSRSVAARFSAAASTYDQFAKVQQDVALKLMRFLNDIPKPDRIIEIGCGTGLLTQLVSDHFPDSNIEGIDIATDLVEIARRRFAGNHKISFQITDALTFRPAAPVPLVVSTSTIHWISPLDELFLNVSRMLSRDGRLVFSMMIKGTLIELHEARKRVAHDKPVLSMMPDTDQVLEALNKAGLMLKDRQEETIQVGYPTATDLLYSLHNVGVTGGGISSSGQPLSRMEMAKLLTDYAECYASKDGGVFATYRVLYGVAIPREKT